jgi:hypothetical protein
MGSSLQPPSSVALSSFPRTPGCQVPVSRPSPWFARTAAVGIGS